MYAVSESGQILETTTHDTEIVKEHKVGHNGVAIIKAGKSLRFVSNFWDCSDGREYQFLNQAKNARDAESMFENLVSILKCGA